MAKLLYRYFTQTIRTSGRYAIDQGCNGFVVINKGTDTVVVDNVPLLPPPGPGVSGESIGVSGNVGEVLDKETIDITFLTNTGPLAFLVQKVYNVHQPL